MSTVRPPCVCHLQTCYFHYLLIIFCNSHTVFYARKYPSIDPQFFKQRVRLQRPRCAVKINAKETDQRACNINGQCSERILLHDATALLHQACLLGQTQETQDADNVWRCSQNGRRLEAADAKRTHGGHKADRRRTKCGDAARAPSRRTQGGQWRTHGGQAPGKRPENIAVNFTLLSKREPHSKQFGEKLFANWLLPLSTMSHLHSCSFGCAFLGSIQFVVG